MGWTFSRHYSLFSFPFTSPSTRTACKGHCSLLYCQLLYFYHQTNMHLFGRAKAKPTPQEAIVKLRETQQMLQKRETFLQTKIDNELKTARANATKNKRSK